jgi:hypothetical protein
MWKETDELKNDYSPAVRAAARDVMHGPADVTAGVAVPARVTTMSKAVTGGHLVSAIRVTTY